MITPVFNGISHYQGLLLAGLGQTVMLALVVIATGLLGGLILTLLRVTRLPLMTQSVGAWVYLFRNIPLIMLIALMHYAILPFMGYTIDFFFSAWLAMSLSASAYFAEIYRGGFKTLQNDEKEAASVIGLSLLQQIRYVLIPLVFIRMAPALINQSVSLIKDTSLASLIGVIELTRSAEIVYEHTFHEGEMLTLIALIYFVLCYSLSTFAKKLQLKNV